MHLSYCVPLDVAELEGGESKVTTLIGAAASIDNVYRMDPLGSLQLYIVTGLYAKST